MKVNPGLLLAVLCVLCGFIQPCGAADKTPGKSNAATNKAVTPDSRKKIGVISDLGEEFNVQTIGITIFQNEKATVPIGSWGIDAFATAKIAAALKARFNVIPLKLSHDGLQRLSNAPGSLFGDRDGYICNVLRAESPNQQFDYYLRLSARESPYANTNQFVKGLGIVRRPGFDTGYTYVHAIYSLEVLDGKTCQSLRTDSANNLENFLFAPIHGPHKEVDRSYMPNPASNAVRDAKLQEVTRTILEQALNQSIPRLIGPQ